MGNKISKQRKLGDTISKATNINRSNINQLPSEQLKIQYEQNQQSSHPPPPTVDESLNQKPLNPSQIPKFDAKYLSKKLKQTPEGKDGFDPQVEKEFNPNFVNSINHLGKQIKSHDLKSNLNPNNIALKQLSNRKSLFEKGEKELESQMNQTDRSSIKRSMIHPRTLTAILNDLQDSRVSKDQILKDYQLDDHFLNNLHNRFKVASNIVVIEEEASHDQIAPKNSTKRFDDNLIDYNGQLNENLDKQKLKNLQNRLN